MGNFERGGDRGGFRGGGDRGGFKGGGRGGFGGGRGGDRGPVTMHNAICASCKKPCEVPFRPSGDKPVYCRDCFAGRSAMGGDRSSRQDPRSNNSQPSAPSQNSGNGEIKKQLEQMNIKLDKLVSAMQEFVLKGALKEVTKESKENPKVVAPTKIVEKMIAKKAVKAKK